MAIEVNYVIGLAVASRGVQRLDQRRHRARPAEEDDRVGFDAMAEAGFKYVGFSGAKTPTGRVIGVKSSVEEAALAGEEARKRGLTVTNIYAGGLALENGPENLRKLIDNCHAAGGWSVLLSSVSPEKTYQACCRTIAACCDYAAEKQIVIVLKPHGGTTGTAPRCATHTSASTTSILR